MPINGDFPILGRDTQHVTESKTFSATVSGPGGTNTCSADVHFINPSIDGSKCVMNPNPDFFLRPGVASLNVQILDPTYTKITFPDTGQILPDGNPTALPSGGAIEVNVTATKTYRAVIETPTGTGTCSATIRVVKSDGSPLFAPPTCGLTASPSTVLEGKPTQLTLRFTGYPYASQVIYSEFPLDRNQVSMSYVPGSSGDAQASVTGLGGTAHCSTPLTVSPTAPITDCSQFLIQSQFSGLPVIHITSESDLASISQTSHAIYRLDSDIALVQNLPRINLANSVFDGQGHTISHLRFQETLTSGVGGRIGLFGTVTNSLILNLKLSDISINIPNGIVSLVGSLAGVMSGTICKVSAQNGSIQPQGYISNVNAVGGLVGRMNGRSDDPYNSSILDSQVNLNVSAGSQTGGLVGQADQVLIVGSSVAGTVVGHTQTGGIAGTFSGSIRDSQFSGTASADIGQELGGVVGSGSGLIQNAKVTADINGMQTTSGTGNILVGGIAGLWFGTLDSCSYQGAIVAFNQNVAGIAGSLAGNVNKCTSQGSITAYNGAAGLVADMAGGMQKSQTSMDVTSWPSYPASVFAGGIAVLNPGSTVSDCSASGRVTSDVAAGFVNINSAGTIQNSSYTGALVSGRVVGGFVFLNRGTISRSYSTGRVKGGMAAGGFAATNAGVIQQSHSSADVLLEISGSSNAFFPAGGLVALNGTGTIGNPYPAQNKIIDSYSTGKVLVTNASALASIVGRVVVYAGGLIGVNGVRGDGTGNYLFANSGGTVTNTFSTGLVTSDTFASSIVLGGLIGRTDIGSVTGSYWDMETSISTSPGGGTAKKDIEMRTQSTFVGWDFSNIWKMAGYPELP